VTKPLKNDLVAGRPWVEVGKVSRPAMTVYPPTGKNTGVAVVVFPPVALEDVQRTVGSVRFHAAERHLDPHKVGVLGFSAGGRLVAAISAHFEKRLYPASMPPTKKAAARTLRWRSIRDICLPERSLVAVVVRFDSFVPRGMSSAFLIGGKFVLRREGARIWRQLAAASAM
jgi:alpha/beta hydrolase fold